MTEGGRGEPTARRIGWWMLVGAVALIIAGLRWDVVARFSKDLPDWDQWDSEGLHMLAQWFHSTGVLAGAWLPQNEHRCVITKVVHFLVTLANGQWDQQLQATLNVALPITLAVLFSRWLRRNATPAVWPLAALVFCCAWALPVAWHNIIAAFHSAQFYLLLTAWLSLSILPLELPWTRRWWVGAVAAALGVVTMASGFLAATCVVIMIGLRAIVKRVEWRPYLPTLILCTVLTIFGYLIKVDVPAHAAMKADSVRGMVITLVNSMRWPTGITWLVPLLWFPVAGVVLAWWRRAETKEGVNGAIVVIAVGGWVFAQLLAAAVFRGGSGVEPASRYTDNIAMGLAINALGCAWLVSHCQPRLRASLWVATLGWTGVVASFSYKEARTAYTVFLPPMVDYHAETITTTRDYIVTGKREALLQGRVPYPGVENFKFRVDIKSLQAILPASVRAPIKLVTDGEAGPFAVPMEKPERDPVTGILVTPPAPLPAGFPPLGMDLVIGSGSASQGGTWRSRPIDAEGSFLRFSLAGTWNDPAVSLTLCNAVTGEVITKILPPDPSKSSWQTAFVPRPKETFVVVARDESADGWIAFTQPRVEAFGSSLARRALPSAGMLTRYGIGLFLLSTALIIWKRKPSLPHRQSA